MSQHCGALNLQFHENHLTGSVPTQFGALDEMTRSRLNSDLLHLWEARHWTVLFVTHNIYEAVYLSSRVVVMAARPGRVVADIPITAPYPRSEGFRTSTAFNGYCRKITDALSAAENRHRTGDKTDGNNRSNNGDMASI